MALTAAELVAYLRLDKGEFDRGMGQAEGTMRKGQGKFRDWAGGMGRAAAEVTTVAAGAAAGLATSVFNTGISYNTLQQQSRAALETIMDSGKDANLQMDKLDEFATTSPFAKDVFIQAQQQLLGFGQEAEDVIPTLSSVEDAVAAVGGTNQDIAAIVNVLANIHGQGKITGDTLQRLGLHGIDAAEIIGDQMGKTGEAIRKEITEGTLDADEAFEALTTGMDEKFSGAAANVKDTAVGSADRITAAFRDVGSEMAKPFVDPQGGGRLIDWSNDFADALRALESQMPSLVKALDDRLAPAFDDFRIKMKDAKDAINDWDVSDFDTTLDKLSQHAPGIAGLSAAVFTLGSKNIPVLKHLTGAIGPLPAALGAAALASPAMRDGLKQLYEAGKPLIGTIADLAEVASGAFTGGLELAGDALGLVADIIGPVVEWFSELPEPIRNAAAAAVIFSTAGGPARDALTNIASGVGNAISSFGGWAGTFEGALDSTDDFKAAVSLARESVGTSAKTGLRGAGRGLLNMLGGGWGIAFMGATALVTLWMQEQKKAKERAEELRETLDEQTGALTESSEAFFDKQLAEDLADESLGTLQTSMDTFNVSSVDMVDAIMGQEGAFEALKDSIVDKHIALGHEQEDAQHLMEISPVVEYLEEQIEVYEAQETAIKAAAEAERIRQSRLSDAERSHEAFTESLKIVVDETANMGERVEALNDALDELNNVTTTQEERDRDLAESQRDLTGFFKDNKGAIEDSDQALIDMSTGLPAHTELGGEFNDMLQRMGTDSHTAAIEARDNAEAQGESDDAIQAAVRDAYEPYITALGVLEDQGFLTSKEVDTLTASIIGTPEITSFIITHGDSVTDVEQDVLSLIEEIYALPDGETYITDEDTSQEVIDELNDLGIEVKELPDGEVGVKVDGIPEAEEVMDRFTSKARTARVGVSLNTSGARAGFINLQADVRKNLIEKPKHDGAIDTFGMKDGGVTGPNVMDVAQMVAPGDIRYAGDRTDVDEAWIPLDGSKRSRTILDEANERMPGYEGMESGGLTGTLTPPALASVGGPDTSELLEIWQDTMDTLEGSTQDSFETIRGDTAESQRQMEGQVTASGANMVAGVTESQIGMEDRVKASGSQMSSDTSKNQRSMENRVALAGRTMSSDTSSSQRDMVDRVKTSGSRMASDTGNKQRAMTDITRDQLYKRSRDTWSRNEEITKNTRDNLDSMRSNMADQMSKMRTNSETNFQNMKTNLVRSAVQMRSGANTEFTSMKSQGIRTTSEMRTGIVSEMDRTKSPFTGKINDLIGVLQKFSSSLNTAYGDLGIDIGKPTKMASGGVLPGYSPGQDIHKFVSPSGGRLHLSGGEAIMRPEVPRALGAGWVNSVNAAARTGGVSAVRKMMGGETQAFSSGGIFDGEFTDKARSIGTEYKSKLPKNWTRPLGRNVIDNVVDGIGDYVEEMFSEGGDGTGAWNVRPTKGRITSKYGAGRGRYPHAGMDVAKRHGEPTVSPAAGVVRQTGWNIGPGRTGIGLAIEHAAKLFTYMGHNPVGGLRVKKGDLVKPGQRVGAQGNTGNSTGAHAHIEAHRGKMWNDVDPMPYWLSAGSGGAASLGGSRGGSDRWSGLVKMALAKNSLPTSPAYVSAWMRQIQTESGGNPNAKQGIVDINSIRGYPARGLLQVIPPTFAAHKHSGHGNIMNPLDNALAGMAYAKSRYGVTGMLNAIGRGRGYKNGTNYARSGISLVGEEGPEAVAFGGGEKVLTNRQTKGILGGSSGLTERDAVKLGKAMAQYMPVGGGLNINNPVVKDVDDLAQKTTKLYRRSMKQMSRR